MPEKIWRLLFVKVFLAGFKLTAALNSKLFLKVFHSILGKSNQSAASFETSFSQISIVPNKNKAEVAGLLNEIKLLLFT